MRRLVALLALVAFAAATAAPALAVCRLRAKSDECCCAPAPPNALCAPDCCDHAGPIGSVADVTTQLRGVAFVAAPTAPILVPWLAAAIATAPPAPGALVALHERAAPRRPLLI